MVDASVSPPVPPVTFPARLGEIKFVTYLPSRQKDQRAVVMSGDGVGWYTLGVSSFALSKFI